MAMMDRWQLQMSVFRQEIDKDRVIAWEESSYQELPEDFLTLFRYLMSKEIAYARTPSIYIHHEPAEYRIYDRVERVYHYYHPPRGYWSEPVP